MERATVMAQPWMFMMMMMIADIDKGKKIYF
jgi:hypothetical protein